MTETYRITAVPTLYSEGEYRGKLKRVTFTAASPNNTRQWFAKNCGQFPAAFAKLMPSSVADMLLSSLLCGDQAQFPGLYREDQFECGFLFEWTPVYLVLPPTFFHQNNLA